MKRLLTILTFGIISQSVYSQIGAVAPNFTEKDINGVSHDLYTYLNQGKVVVLELSETT